MAVTEERTIVVADVEVTDEYRIALHTPESVMHVTDLSPEQASQLGLELLDKASEAKTVLAADLAGRVVEPCGFDVDGPVTA